MIPIYIDTANLEIINNIWEKLRTYKEISNIDIYGITTNPNAFFKIQKLRLNEWIDTLNKLSDKLASIRGDNNGIVFIQCPNADMSFNEVIDYIGMLKESSNKSSYIGLKIPPYQEVLENLHILREYKIPLNVTGVSDCATAIRCLSCDVDVVSIIPGRMEEVGINAKDHIKYTMPCLKENQHIIAGSMRTIEGLKWTIDYGTVPTIGEKVWDLLLQNNNIQYVFSELQYSDEIQISPVYPPDISDVNRQLSINFFNQMNECGKQAYSDFQSKYVLFSI